MNLPDERYAIVLPHNHQPLARWLRPLEAAAYVETYNRLMGHTPCQAQMVRELSDAPVAPQPAAEKTS